MAVEATARSLRMQPMALLSLTGPLLDLPGRVPWLRRYVETASASAR